MSKSRILRTTMHSKHRDISLASALLVTTAKARDEAHKLRKIARTGGDPLAGT